MITCTFENDNQASLRHVTADVLTLKDNKLLLVKRNSRLLEGGKWALTGGYVERDETILQAARREVYEESGWEIKDLKLLTYIDKPERPNDDRQNVVFVYFCTATQKTGRADDESDEQKWFSLDALPPKETIAFDHYEFIKMYLQTITEN